MKVKGLIYKKNKIREKELDDLRSYKFETLDWF